MLNLLRLALSSFFFGSPVLHMRNLGSETTISSSPTCRTKRTSLVYWERRIHLKRMEFLLKGSFKERRYFWNVSPGLLWNKVFHRTLPWAILNLGHLNPHSFWLACISSLFRMDTLSAFCRTALTPWQEFLGQQLIENREDNFFFSIRSGRVRPSSRGNSSYLFVFLYLWVWRRGWMVWEGIFYCRPIKRTDLHLVEWKNLTISTEKNKRGGLVV